MTSTDPLLLTLEHAAKRLSVSPRTVRRLIDAGELAPVRIGRSLRVSVDSVQAYVDRNMTPSNNSERGSPCRNDNRRFAWRPLADRMAQASIR